MTKHPLEEYKVEIYNETDGFRFRLVHVPSCTQTYWCGYQSIALLDDVCAMTGYYTGDNALDLKPITVLQAMQQFAMGEEPK